MKIIEEQIEQVINFGVFDYDAEKIASLLEVDISEVIDDMNDEESELYKLLKKGRDMADYVIDLKLFELAKNGDLKALDKLEHRKRHR